MDDLISCYREDQNELLKDVSEEIIEAKIMTGLIFKCFNC